MESSRFDDIIKSHTSLLLSCQTALGTLFLVSDLLFNFSPLSYSVIGLLLGILISFTLVRIFPRIMQRPALLQRITIAFFLSCVVLSLSLLCLGYATASSICLSTIGSAALAMVLFFNWDILLTEAQEFSLFPLPHFGRGLLGVWVGFVVGLLAALILFFVQNFINDTIGARNFILCSCILSVVLVIISAAFSPDEKETIQILSDSFAQKYGLEEPEPLHFDDKIFIKRCNAIITRFSLTEREGEVLEMIARGRNAQYVQDNLIVSLSTAKTHIYHIYQKLNVNNQQQLMDLVDHALESSTHKTS